MATARAQLEEFLARFSPEVAAVGRGAVAWMRRRFPGAAALVYDNYNALAIGFGPGERASEAVFSIAIFPRWVSLCFLWGAGLEDPQGLLKGTGNRVRSMRLESAQTLDEPTVRALIDAEAQRQGFGRGGEGRGEIVIKSISAKQRPRRPEVHQRGKR